MKRVLQTVATLCYLLALTACMTDAALETSGPTEFLDEATGATITTVQRPLIFARERRDLAANSRDYVTLAAASVNRSGKIHYLLVAYAWSTVDSRLREPEPDDDALVIAADDRRIRLATAGRTAAQQGIVAPIHEPPGPTQAPKVYETDLQTLRFLSAAHQLSVQRGSDELAPSYVIWSDERAALAQFVLFLKGER